MNLQHVDIFFQIVVFLFAISVHESAHAWMARRCGDPTASMLGRVTLNPIKHIDPIGTIVLPVLALVAHFPVIGWAKPTPVNPRNFKNPVRDDILTSVAGPVSNFLVVILAVIVLLAISFSSANGREVVRTLAMGTLLDAGALTPVVLIFYDLMLINILLGIFNLIPVPPLDGSHVIRHFLSDGVREIYDRAGIFGLMILMFFGGRFLWALVRPVLGFFNQILMSF